MRKTKIVTVDLEGRDKGKQFLLTEMPAHQGEKWAIKATVALAHAGVEIPQEMMGAGWAALAYGALNALSNVSFDELEPLLDEMMRCIQAIRDPDNPALTFPLVETDTEEIVTRFYLRAELFSLHSGFSMADVKSRLAPARPSTTSPTTRTSRRRSAR